MLLNSIKPANGSKQSKRRVGRGIGSGFGKTCGRGHKGQKSRTGGYHKVGFEGGQMPIQRRLPKRGFVNSSKKKVIKLRSSVLDKLSESNISISTLVDNNKITLKSKNIKIYKTKNSIQRSYNLSGIKVSKSIREELIANGGSVT